MIEQLGDTDLWYDHEDKLCHRLNMGQIASQIRVVWDMGQFIGKRDCPTQSGTVGQSECECMCVCVCGV